MLWYGQENNHNILVMELLSENLESKYQACKRNFTTMTILLLIGKKKNSIDELL